MNVLDMISNQQHIYDVLKQNKIKDRLSHAYLFYGDEGVGKKEMAYALACLFYCKNDGCLSCDTCQNILNDQHLNVTYIGVLESKKLISKEQIIDLQEEFSKTSLLEGPRIYIVDGIDTASASAQNSLLKFIEEPINNTPTIGIFIATDLANVVSTIVSRCSLIHFPSIEVKKLVGQLEKEGIDSLDAALSSITTNNIMEAKELLQTNQY
ncbi:MAG: DNA polymerase III subunit, partial [Anaeroplasmataceae bacterium]|nr:DNA polymerase III subunit [Anaeroplasmataceae bacterium]